MSNVDLKKNTLKNPKTVLESLLFGGGTNESQKSYMKFP